MENIRNNVGVEYEQLGVFALQRVYRNVQEILERGVVHKSLVEAVKEAGAVTNLEILEDNPKIAEALLEEWKRQLPAITKVLFEKIEAFEGREMGAK